jgi:hypothetical protein
MTPKEEQLRGKDAQQLLQNPAFKMAMDKVSAYLESKAQTCDPDNKEMAQRIIIAKQIHAKLIQELVKLVENGEYSIDMHKEIEPKVRIFKR